MTIDGHAAHGRFFQTVQQTNQRTLSGAAVANNPVNLSLFNRQINVIHCGNGQLAGRKNFRNIFQDDHIVIVSAAAYGYPASAFSCLAVWMSKRV